MPISPVAPSRPRSVDPSTPQVAQPPPRTGESNRSPARSPGTVLLLSQQPKRSRVGRAERKELTIEALELGKFDKDLDKLLKASAKINTIAAGIEKEGLNKYWRRDKAKTLGALKNLTDLSKSLVEIRNVLSKAVETSTGRKTEAALRYASKLLSAADLLAKLTDDSKLRALKKDPTDFDKAAAWASHVGDTFDAAGALLDFIPEGVLPGAVTATIKGLFKAPKNYIAAFTGILRVHYDRVDEAAGVSWETRRATVGEKEVWAGDLTGVYVDAHFIQPRGLQEFMTDNRKSIHGLDLWKVDEETGRALLATKLRNEGGNSTWIAFLESGR